MTSLRDPFDTVHKKDIKNKAGQVVAQVDYVGWSQSADRLDEAVPDGWSFSIMGIGEDWVHGRLTIGDRHFENIGYAENAEAEWKKEVLKDAASDAFKRCAALAGVARYLYDKDAARPRPQPVREDRTVTPIRRPVDADLLEPDDEDVAELHAGIRDDLRVCPIHDVNWNGSPGDLWHKDAEGRYCRHPDNVKKARQR